MPAFDAQLNVAARLRLFGFRKQQLGEIETAWRRHHAGRQNGDGISPESDVDRHHPAGDRGHAADHHRQQFRPRHRRHVRLHDDRRFGLPHEDVGRRRQRLGAARAQRVHHPARHQPDDDLQHAEVIEHGEERGDEDDGRQRREGKDEAVLGPEDPGHHLLVRERPEHEVRAGVGELEEALDDVRHRAEERVARPEFANLELEDEKRERQLQGHAPEHGPPADRGQVRRARGADSDEADRPGPGLPAVANHVRHGPGESRHHDCDGHGDEAEAAIGSNRGGVSHT